jgi:hypothetical protein
MILMKFFLALCTSFTVAAWLAIGQTAAATDSVGQQLTVKIHQMDEGLGRGDVSSYLAVAVPNLVALHDDDVFSTRQSFEQHLSEDLNAFKISSFNSHINNLRVYDDFAMTDVTSTFVGDMPDKKDPSVRHNYVINLKFKYEWRHIDGDWKLTRFVQLGQTGTVDGKTIRAHS